MTRLTAFRKKRAAALASRLAQSRKSMVFLAESNARYKYFRRPLTMICVDMRLVDAGGLTGGFQVRPAALLEFRSIVLHPAVDRSVVDDYATLTHHLF